MARWQMMTSPQREDGKLTGKYSDDDCRFRLKVVLSSQLLQAVTDLAKAHRQFVADIAGARAHGQGTIADEALIELGQRLSAEDVAAVAAFLAQTTRRP